jgi:hypothetical protein
MEIKTTEILKKEKAEQELEFYKENEINWLDDDFFDSWDKVKGHWHKIIKPNSKEQFDVNESPKIEKWFLLAHSKNEIEGKPQLVHDVMQTIPLIRLTSKIHKEKLKGELFEYKTPRYLFFDERYDKRYDGAMIDIFSLDFWIYKIKFEGREYYIYSQIQLPDGKCKLKGMCVDLSDVSEMSKTLKINSLSHLFIAKEVEPAVKTLKKKELVDFIFNKKININSWLNNLALHPSGSINNFPFEFEILRSSFLLSGKVDGWPLHLAVMGPFGSRKTMGVGETIYSKFEENKLMASATNYRLKGLIPSFKKTPAEPGYILECHRIAIIDELGKLVEAEANKHDRTAMNIMGEFNDILEHKQRSGGSGNDFININPTAKSVFLFNPVSGKQNLYQHVGLIDPTTMSRIIWWVQDSAEQKLVFSSEGIIRNPPHTLTSPSILAPTNPPHTLTSICNKYINNKNILLGRCRGCVGRIEKQDFLTIYDSCNSFLSEIDEKQIECLVAVITNQAKEPMKSVWNSRAYHHIKLLVDGICKMRCLFDDKDSTFTAKQEDYDLAEKVLIRMVQGWDTNLSQKEEFR